MAPHPAHGDLVRLTELDAAWATVGAGARLDAVRRAAPGLRARILAGGGARAVRTADIATFPYPAAFALQGVASGVPPFAFLRNRMQLVQVEAAGRTITILVNPSDPERSAAAPFFARMEQRFGKLVRKLMSTVHGSLPQVLARWGVAPADIDYVTFDHLHVQDLRGLLAPGTNGATYLPRASLLVQRGELDTLAALHPLQADWYLPRALGGIPADRIVALDGDYLLGAGFALVRTPGHTAGNHTLVAVTDRGAWTISENGIGLDAYAPGQSKIRGVARYARETGAEVILNANTREHSLDQYTSMVLEKLLADALPDHPGLPQHLASSELVAHPLAPGLGPTVRPGELSFGDVRRSPTLT